MNWSVLGSGAAWSGGLLRHVHSALSRVVGTDVGRVRDPSSFQSEQGVFESHSSAKTSNFTSTKVIGVRHFGAVIGSRQIAAKGP
jgi:hypothetical protein